MRGGSYCDTLPLAASAMAYPSSWVACPSLPKGSASPPAFIVLAFARGSARWRGLPRVPA